MTKFKPGDRVRLRGSSKKGLARDPVSSSVLVQWDDGAVLQNIHPELLIRLKPKAKLRELFLTESIGQPQVWIECNPKSPGTTRFREVRKAKEIK